MIQEVKCKQNTLSHLMFMFKGEVEISDGG